MTNAQLLIVLAAIVVSALAVYYFIRRLVIASVSDIWKDVRRAATALERVADVGARPRLPLPIQSKGPLKPGVMTILKAEPKHPFEPQRLFISEACGGAKNWAVNDIRIDGKTQFSQSGDIPGDMFSSSAIDNFVNFDVAHHNVEVAVTYIGNSESGAPFYGSMMGSIVNADPPMMA